MASLVDVWASGPPLATMLAVNYCVLALALSMRTMCTHRFFFFLYEINVESKLQPNLQQPMLSRVLLGQVQSLFKILSGVCIRLMRLTWWTTPAPPLPPFLLLLVWRMASNRLVHYRHHLMWSLDLTFTQSNFKKQKGRCRYPVRSFYFLKYWNKILNLNWTNEAPWRKDKTSLNNIQV